MNRPTDPIPTADLLVHAASLRHLAAQLVRDAAQADDLVQRTWLQALAHPPRQRGRLGPWLRTVLRNEARQDHRSDHARRTREQGIAVRSPGSAADDVLARSEQLQHLVAAVRALPEPYRTPMLLRWVDGHEPGEIARRLGERPGTVRSHLSRGMHLLRERLDHAASGTRRAWALALIPLAASPTRSTAVAAAAAGGLAMKGFSKAIAVAVTVLLLGVGGWYAFNLGSSDDKVDERTLIQQTRRDVVVGLQGAAEDEQPAELSEIVTKRADAQAWTLIGRVLTLEKTPIAGAEVLVESICGGVPTVVARALSNDAGEYTIDLSPMKDVPPLVRAASRLIVSARKAGAYPRVHQVDWHDRASTWPIRGDVQMVPGHLLRGRVVDRNGAPVTFGAVMLDAGFGGSMENVRLDATGSYAFLILDSKTVHVQYQMAERGYGRVGPLVLDPSRDTDAPEMRLVDGEGISGIARFPDGQAAAFVQVSAGWVESTRPGETMTDLVVGGGVGYTASTVWTDASGHFEIHPLLPGRYQLHHTYSKVDGAPVFATGETDARILVRGHRVRIRVVDEAGEPVVGASGLMRFTLDADIPDVSSEYLDGSGRPIQFWGKPGEAFEFAASVPGSPTAVLAATVPTRTHDATYDVVLRTGGGPPGTIRVRLRKPNGSKFTHYQAKVETLVARSNVLDTKITTGEDNDLQIPNILAGMYRLTITPERESAPAHRELWFPITRDVVLAPGRTVAVDLVAEPGARIRLTLNDPRGKVGQHAPYELFVVRPASEPRPLRTFTRQRGAGWSWGGLRLGTPSVSNDLLEPGGYTLRILNADAVVAERAFEVAAGEILDLTVDLPE